MSLLALLADLGTALAKVLGLAQEQAQRQGDKAAGAAMQRAEDFEDESERIIAAARAEFERLPDGPDPFDRDGGG